MAAGFRFGAGVPDMSSPEVPSLPPGTRLNGGKYVVSHELNRGATAVVYAAQDVLASTMVALKVMSGSSQVPVKVVKREIEFSARAQHPNIVRLLDVFAENAQLIIVLELIVGPDLLDLLNEQAGRLQEPQAAFYFCQLLQAVIYMHNNGFTHRDIKPENCMVQRSTHQLKLIDFGLSKHLESVRTRGIGTPDYLSPEMLQVGSMYSRGAGHAAYDARAVDAWAMGVLMFLLVTGKYPFEDPLHPNNLPSTIQNVLAGRMRAFPDHVSPGCRALILGLLKVDPAQRTTLQALAQDAWLLQQASAWAASVRRLDLLAPLIHPPGPAPLPHSVPPVLESGQSLPYPSRALTTADLSTQRSAPQPHSALSKGWPTGPLFGSPATPQSTASNAATAQSGRQDYHDNAPMALDDAAEHQEGTAEAKPKSALGRMCTYLKNRLKSS